MQKIGQNDSMRTVDRRIGKISLFLLLIFSVWQEIPAQEIRIDTKLAVFEVTVRDDRGEPVNGLTADDFRLYENDILRKIEFFEPVRSGRRPLSVVFALDVSGSMSEQEIGRLKSAVSTFAHSLAKYEAYFSIISFAMNVRSVQSFTNRRDKLENALDRLGRNRDGLSTHTFDALDFAIRQIERKSPRFRSEMPPRRAVIVITDGFPVGDVATPKLVVERANAANISIFNIILPSFARTQSGTKRVPTPLEISGIAGATGGRNFVAGTKSPDEILAEIANEITGSYAIAFYPEHDGDIATARRVRIESVKGFAVRQNRDTYTLGR